MFFPSSVCCPPLALANPTITATVQVTAPEEVYLRDDAECSAAGDFSIDAEEQQEVPEGATVTQEYHWSYSPAELVSDRDPDSQVTIYYPGDTVEPGSYLVSVEYKVTLTEVGGRITTQTATDSATIEVKDRLYISVAAEPPYVCTGGYASEPDQRKIIAHVFDSAGYPAEGVSVDFAILGNSLDENMTDNGSVSPTSATTDEYGVAETTLTSGHHGSNDEEQEPDMWFWVTVQASVADQEDAEATVDVLYWPPACATTFWDPDDPGTQVTAMPESGHVLVRHELSCCGIPVDHHTLALTFRLWTVDTLNAAAQAKYELDFDELTEAEQAWIFEHTGPTYEGSGNATYGTQSVTSGETDADGRVETVYTVGTTTGYLQFVATDQDVLMPESQMSGMSAQGAGACAVRPQGFFSWRNKLWWRFVRGARYTVTVTKVNAQGVPDPDVVLGQRFALKVVVDPGWYGGSAKITIEPDSGADQDHVRFQTVSFLDPNKQPKTVQFTRGIGIAGGGTTTISADPNGNPTTTYIYCTAYEMTPSKVFVKLEDSANKEYGYWQATEEHIWAYVIATSHAQLPENDTETPDVPGNWFNNQVRCALPSVAMFKKSIGLATSLPATGIEAVVRDTDRSSHGARTVPTRTGVRVPSRTWHA